MFAIPPQMLGFLKQWWPAFAGAALFGTFLLLVYCEGQSAGRQSEIVEQQNREIEVQRDLNRANENAAGLRVEQASSAARQEKELTDALKATDDPDRRRVLRGCIIMRQQGRDTSNIPACR